MVKHSKIVQNTTEYKARRIIVIHILEWNATGNGRTHHYNGIQWTVWKRAMMKQTHKSLSAINLAAIVLAGMRV